MYFSEHLLLYFIFTFIICTSQMLRVKTFFFFLKKKPAQNFSCLLLFLILLEVYSFGLSSLNFKIVFNRFLNFTNI